MKLLRTHGTWIVFALVALAILPTAATAQPHPAPHALAQLNDVGGIPIYLTPQFLAGVAAVVAACADGISKVVYSLRRIVTLDVCPFSTNGVARCAGMTKPIPPVPDPLPFKV